MNVKCRAINFINTLRKVAAKKRATAITAALTFGYINLFFVFLFFCCVYFSFKNKQVSFRIEAKELVVKVTLGLASNVD